VDTKHIYNQLKPYIMAQSNLTKAFKALRKKGYFARQNFWCCQSCAWSAMTDEQANKTVFYHRQDADDLRDSGTCHLAWSGNGQEIVDVLKENGVEVDWNGGDGTRIKITV
jgi:hypothetical protein